MRTRARLIDTGRPGESLLARRRPLARATEQPDLGATLGPAPDCRRRAERRLGAQFSRALRTVSNPDHRAQVSGQAVYFSLSHIPNVSRTRDRAFCEPAASQVRAGHGGAEQQPHAAHRVESRNMRRRSLMRQADLCIASAGRERPILPHPRVYQLGWLPLGAAAAGGTWATPAAGLLRGCGPARSSGLALCRPARRYRSRRCRA